MHYWLDLGHDSNPANQVHFPSRRLPNRWPHPGYDLFKANDKAADPQWIVRCNEHASLSGAPDVKTADIAGRRRGRELWCTACKRQATKPTAKAPANARTRNPARTAR